VVETGVVLTTGIGLWKALWRGIEDSEKEMCGRRESSSSRAIAGSLPCPQINA